MCSYSVSGTMNLRIVLLFVSAAVCFCAPVKRGGFVDDKMQHYLMQFGYLPQSDLETGNLRTEESLRSAIRQLQSFAGLKATGEVDTATKKLLARPRCGMPDVVEDGFDGGDRRDRRRYKRYSLHGQTWGYTNLTWSLRPEYPRNIDVGRVRYVLARALDVWAQHSKLTFQELDSDTADILVSFQRGYHNDGYPFDGKGQILAHAFFPGSGRGGDAHFDDDEIWLTEDNDDNEEGTSLFLVAAHEFGHSLGLSHSSVEGALMYPWYQGLKPNFELPDDDKHGIQQMYGAKEDRLWGRNPVYNPYPITPPTRPTRPTTTTTRRPYLRPEKPKYHKPYDPKYPDKTNFPKHYPDRKYPDGRVHTHHGHYPDRDRDRERYPSRYPDRNNPERHPDRNNPERHPDRNNPERHPERYPERYPERQPERYPERQPERVPERQPERHPEKKYPLGNSPPHYPERHPGYPEKTTERPTQPTRNPTGHTTDIPDKPDTCDTSYDAISVIRREVFIFKDAYLWRIGDSGLNPSYPVEITRMWHGLPRNLSHVDAVYERPDSKIVFFIGKQYYLHNGNNVERGYPKSLTTLGLPSSLEKIDGSMVWGHNGKTYFYSGTMYWRFDEDLGKVELDYPRDMSMWKGVGYNIDTVFQWKDGKTYFFKGKGFWKFNDLRMRVENEQQTLSAPFWMGCPRPLEGPNTRTREKLLGDPVNSATRHFSGVLAILLVVLSSKFWTLIT